jgi:hypothetical protein
MLRIFTDEDVYAAVAPALRSRGLESISAPEAARLGIADEQQLEWAAAQDLSILTFNVADFARLHSQWIRLGRHHAGIILSAQVPIGELIRRLENLNTGLSGAELAGRLEFLGDWR